MTKRDKVIARIKKTYRKHHATLQKLDHLDCGLGLASELYGVDFVGVQREMNRCVSRLRRIDPSFPRS